MVGLDQPLTASGNDVVCWTAPRQLRAPSPPTTTRRPKSLRKKDFSLHAVWGFTRSSFQISSCRDQISRCSELLSCHCCPNQVLKFRFRFAPLQVPRRRRIQTASVAIWSLLLPFCLITFFWACSIPLLWPIVVPYAIWIFYLDTSYNHGGRPKMWFKRLRLWRYFASYYPVSMIKEAELPPDRPYVFGYHPHGIIGT